MNAPRPLATAAMLAAATLAACGAPSGGGGVATHSVPAPPATTPSPSSGSPTATTATPTATPAPQELLFAVLEAHSGGDFPLRDDTVAIVGLDGHARAKATFTQRTPPSVGNAAPVLQPEAHVAAGAVYYVDGTGVVRRLAVGSAPQTVVTFPTIAGRDTFSFAVSPDGSHLAASAFRWPPMASNQPGCGLECPWFAPGPFTLDIWTADAGAAPVLVRHQEWPQDDSLPKDVPEVLGWDDAGPVMTSSAVLGSQNTLGGRRWFGPVAHMDAHGNPGPTIGGTDCRAWTELHDGTVACVNDVSAPVSVRTAAGTQVWSANPNGYAGWLALSPDGGTLAYRSTNTHGDFTQLANHDGEGAGMPATFHPQGWLDATTVIGFTGTTEFQGQMALVHTATDTSTASSLGFVGSFVGVVQAAG